jgi:hypothetical protein
MRKREARHRKALADGTGASPKKCGTNANLGVESRLIVNAFDE